MVSVYLEGLQEEIEEIDCPANNTYLSNKMLVPVKENARKYILKFNNNWLLRGIMYAMDQEGLLPVRYE